MAYSKKLRDQVMLAVESGTPKTVVAKKYKVSTQTIGKWAGPGRKQIAAKATRTRFVRKPAALTVKVSPLAAENAALRNLLANALIEKMLIETQ